MAEIQSWEAGLYRLSYNAEKPDIMTIEWASTCLGVIKPPEEKIEAVISKLRSGGTLLEAWNLLEIPVDPIDVTLPLKPYGVFAILGGVPVLLCSLTDLESAQDFATKYVKSMDYQDAVYICFLTGRYYRDGSIGCISNIISKSEPPKKVPFGNVLAMDVDCVRHLFSDYKI